MRGGAVCYIRAISAVASLRIPHSALSRFVPQGEKAGVGEELLLAADAPYFADPGVGVRVGQGAAYGVMTIR